MPSLEMPEFQFRAVDLEPRTPGSKSRGPGDRAPRPDRLSGRLLLGTPVATALTAAAVGDDKETAEFLRARAAQSDFYLVTMACSFQPKEDEPFEKAWLHVNLDRADGVKDPRPSAYSMRPLKASREIKQSRSIKLGADLKIMGVGFEAGGERGVDKSGEEVFVQAYGELTADPFWQFSSREGALLDGSYRLALVVDVPKSVRAQVSVNLEATVRHTFLKLIPYRSDFDGRESLTINLP
jgi:hypothetical protein